MYPNNDYIGKLNWDYENILITKPHCMYLQIAVQSGVLSLVAFLAFAVCCIIKMVRGMRKQYATSKNMTLLSGFAVGIIAYLVMGLTNDSCLVTAPLFWMLIGYGAGLAE